MTTDVKPTLGTQEPLAITEVVRQVAVQTLAMLVAFNVVHLTDLQTGVILAEFGVLSLAFTAIARSIVTPMSRVALTKAQAELITTVTTAPAAAPVDVAPAVTVDETAPVTP